MKAGEDKPTSFTRPVGKRWYLHAMGQHAAIERNKLLIHSHLRGKVRHTRLQIVCFHLHDILDITNRQGRRDEWSRGQGLWLQRVPQGDLWWWHCLRVHRGGTDTTECTCVPSHRTTPMCMHTHRYIQEHVTENSMWQSRFSSVEIMLSLGKTSLFREPGWGCKATWSGWLQFSEGL